MPDPEKDMSDTITRIVNEGDNERLRSMCSLLNSFNYAVQIQSGRKTWEPTDFRLFAISLCAMDQIGKASEIAKEREAKLLDNVEAQLERVHTESKATRMMKGMQ